VRNAGRYDGAYGVIAAIAAVHTLNRNKRRLPFAIEVIAFADEEGVRFPSALSSSRAVAGSFDPACLDDRDAQGTSRGDALRTFGCDPSAIDQLARDPASILGYLELHIEQGPVLQAKNLACGAVTAINGATRGEIFLEGYAGHAGTLPMDMRRDALAAAAEIILKIEETARNTAGLVATVGRIETPGGAVNIVPGRVIMSLDLRSPDDISRAAALGSIRKQIADISVKRNIQARLDVSYDMAAAPCDTQLQNMIKTSMTCSGLPSFSLPSGAGHDGLSFRGRIPIGMIFIRCRDGVSHNPAEYSSPADMETGARLLHETILTLGGHP